jgi:hypothetical protein
MLPVLPADALAEFRRFANARGVSVDSVSISDALDEVIQFYLSVRAEGCDLDGDGDMLLFQYGTYDWGDGPQFELDLTRQLVFDADDEDPEIWHLSLTFLFDPTPMFEAVGNGERWCSSPADVEAQRDFMLASAAYAVASATPLRRVRLSYASAE